MKQTLFFWKKFNERPIRLNGFYRCLVYFTNSWNSNDTFNPTNGLVKSFFSRREDTNLSEIANFFDINSSTRFFLNFLDHFALRSNNSTNKFFVNKHFF